MKRQDVSIESLVDMIDREELQLPEIQRRYVWRASRVRDLLDSLYRGYPSGSILMWETNETVPTRSLQVHGKTGRSEAGKLLLDGQQRLTSLAAVVRGRPIHVRGRKRPIDILFNLEHPDGHGEDVTDVSSDEDSPLVDEDESAENGDGGGAEEESETPDLLELLQKRTFVVASRALAQLPNWVSVSDVFRSTSDREILQRSGVKSFDDPRYERYTSRLSRLRSIKAYMYVVNVLERELSYEEVAEIFVRVNSLGMKLVSSDLALALISSRWRELHSLVEGFQEECEEKWFTLDTGLLIRAMVVFATQQCRFKSIGSVSTERLKAAWKEAQEGLRYAINFLRTNAGIEDESLLSSPLLMIPIAVHGHLRSNRISEPESREMLYWLLVANARGRYSKGSSESLLNEDLAALFRGDQPQKLIDTLKQQFGRLDIKTEDLIGRGARSPLFSLVYLALKAAGAKDWHSGLGLSLAHQGRLHFIQYHHIFPKVVLRKAGYERAEINEIANLAFISGQTNRRLATKEPGEYLPAIIQSRGAEVLDAHGLPSDLERLTVASYRDFLSHRRERLAEMMNRHLEASRRPG